MTTKIYFGTKPGVNNRGLSRKHIIEGARASLARLGLTYVDVLFCHRPDPVTPIEETVRAMSWLVDQGLTFYWGTSEWSAAEILQASGIADKLGLHVRHMSRYASHPAPPYEWSAATATATPSLPRATPARRSALSWSSLSTTSLRASASRSSTHQCTARRASGSRRGRPSPQVSSQASIPQAQSLRAHVSLLSPTRGSPSRSWKAISGRSRQRTASRPSPPTSAALSPSSPSRGCYRTRRCRRASLAQRRSRNLRRTWERSTCCPS